MFMGESTMKRGLAHFMCDFAAGCVLPALAAGDVSQKVMVAAESVARIVSEYRKDLATGSGSVIGNRPGELLIATGNRVMEGNPARISVRVSEDTAKILYRHPFR